MRRPGVLDEDARWRFGVAGAALVAAAAETVWGVSQAKALLLRCGVVDTGLSSGRVIKERYRSDEYELWSPLAQGHYRVSDSGHISCYLERPLEIP